MVRTRHEPVKKCVREGQKFKTKVYVTQGYPCKQQNTPLMQAYTSLPESYNLAGSDAYGRTGMGSRVIV
jgi:hypothetical protein